MLPLMIIDMQPGFLTGPNKKSLPNVVKHNTHQVGLAKRRKAPIFLVEYNGSNGSTIAAIQDLLVGYSLVSTIRKDYDDVTYALPSKVQNLLKKVKRLRVCGVNTNACVELSVRGILRQFPDLTIELVQRACGNTWGYYEGPPNGRFMWTREFKRIKILK